MIGRDDLVDRAPERIENGVEERRIEDPIAVVELYTVLGDEDATLKWLEKTVESRSPNGAFVRLWKCLPDQSFKFTKSSRFEALLDNIHYPDE